jgi:hypothetical protein
MSALPLALFLSAALHALGIFYLSRVLRALERLRRLLEAGAWPLLSSRNGEGER